MLLSPFAAGFVCFRRRCSDGRVESFSSLLLPNDSILGGGFELIPSNSRFLCSRSLSWWNEFGSVLVIVLHASRVGNGDCKKWRGTAASYRYRTGIPMMSYRYSKLKAEASLLSFDS
jgi:hypothetical protein